MDVERVHEGCKEPSHTDARVRVIATRALPGSAFEELDHVAVRSIDQLDYSPGVTALIAGNDAIDDAVLDLLPDLRIVANYGVGYDLIDVAACSRRGVMVTNTPGVVDGATADLTMALLLATHRRVVETDRQLRNGVWGAAFDPASYGTDFARSTLGIIGLGRIGTAVARRAAGFDVRTLYTNRTRLSRDTERQLGVEWRPLEALVHESDSVSLHVPRTPETIGLLDKSLLALLRDGAVVVNTARGAVIEREPFVAELQSGRIRAGLDVFWDEPNVPPEFLDLPNVVLTPHVGTATLTTREALTRLVVDNVLAVQAGRDPLTPVT